MTEPRHPMLAAVGALLVTLPLVSRSEPRPFADLVEQAVPVVGSKERIRAPQRSPGDTQRVDAAAARKAAKAAQRAFERLRRRHLPFWNGPSGRCDEIVGRFCLWHDSDPSYDPGPEKTRVRTAREQLVTALRDASLAAPEDEWIIGQWVRYLVEAGRLTEAGTAAAGCRADRWWCAALSGFVRHAAGDFLASEESFESALEAMPAEVRRAWEDLSYLLDGDGLDAYEDLEPRRRDDIAAKIWWLADPLIMVPGNERRTEHFSRRVLARLQPGAESPYGVAWGDDLEELLVRYGWPSSWSRRRQPIYSPAGRRPPVTGHDPVRSFRFFPPDELVKDFTSLEALAWDLRPHHPREEYLPSYSHAFDGEAEGFDHQLSVFRRGSGALVVGAYAWMSDSLPPGTPLRVGLVYATERGETAATAQERAPHRGVLIARAPLTDALLGIEALADSAGRAARARIGRRLAAVAGPSLSDILLLDPPTGVAPATLEDALPHARPSTSVRPGDRIGLLWEVYGVPGGARMQVEVSLTKPGKGLLRRTAEWLGLVKNKDPSVSLAWRETSAADENAARYVELQVPDVSTGRYVLSTSIRLADGERATAARLLRVERR